ncbi:glycine reductase [Clostridium collagenovorans DSM 3089]|uniref:Glycine reductase n=3 Tax=Clostridium TaxID=1485 RepID=A0A1M5YJ63_9CLOT|nr:glycine reductase [Clostridium collagenovorans DSM 3089]
MEKLRVVHYINNFFAGIGGEEKADIPPMIKEGAVGPGLSLNAKLGDNGEIVATAICGDSYFGENLEEAKDALISMIKVYNPDVFIAGPAFNAGRYGVACGTIAKAVEEELKIPVITAMYKENPGVDMFKKDLHIIETAISAADMRNTVPKMVKLILKMAKGEEILSPKEEGYIERGIRVNYFSDKRGSDRAIDMLLKKVKGEEFTTEYPMPVFDRVDPNPAVKDLAHTKVAIVTSGGVVPQGNPDRIESSSATKYGIYDITGMNSLSANDFMTVHGGYDRAFVTKNPNLVVPLDVMRDLEKEGVIGELANYFVTTTGTGTSVGNAKGFGEDFSKKLVADGVGAVILTST